MCPRYQTSAFCPGNQTVFFATPSGRRSKPRMMVTFEKLTHPNIFRNKVHLLSQLTMMLLFPRTISTNPVQIFTRFRLLSHRMLRILHFDIRACCLIRPGGGNEAFRSYYQESSAVAEKLHWYVWLQVAPFMATAPAANSLVGGLDLVCPRGTASSFMVYLAFIIPSAGMYCVALHVFLSCLIWIG